MEVFKYPLTIPKSREPELIINLLVGNLSSLNALLVELSILSRADIAENPDRFTEIVTDLRDKMHAELVAEIEKKYGV